MSAPRFEDPRAVLARHGLRPKRGLSQNFLISERAVEAIADALALRPNEVAIELGPGLGTLTAALLRRGARVIAIERDAEMLAVLEAEFASPALSLRRGDATRIDYAAIARELGQKPAVVGNLPYAVTGAIFRNLIAQRAQLARAIVMVQREVGERLLAAPGTRDYGALTVFAQAAFEVRVRLRLPAGAFHPRPRVQSVVVELAPRAQPLAEETKAFRTAVHAAFSGRRKTLRNALATAVGIVAAEAALARAELDPRRRGETLSIAEFASLSRALEAPGSGNA